MIFFTTTLDTGTGWREEERGGVRDGNDKTTKKNRNNSH